MIAWLSDDFFKEETREGFTISSKMKRAWGAQMTILSDFAAVCAKYGLRWYADYGTLLGAVRHRGYIPWDDDIDVSMPRRDYQIFQRLWDRELPDNYRIKTAILYPDYQSSWMTLFNREASDIGKSEEAGRLTKRYCGCVYICGMDIFPLDYVPRDDKQQEVFKDICQRVVNTAACFDAYVQDDSLEKRVRAIETLTGVNIERDENLRPALWQLLDNLSLIWQREDAIGVTCLSGWVNHDEAIRPLECYDGEMYLPFEGMEIPVPSGYAEILKLRFGANWCAPVEGGSAHDYPFYKEQEAT